MIGGAWIDLLLIALLGGAALGLYRLRPAGPAATLTAPAADPPPEAPDTPWRRLRDVYPRVARQAGLAPDRWRWLYRLAKVALGLLLPLTALELWPGWLGGPRWPWAALAAVLGFHIPDLVLLAARNSRRRRVSIALTYFLDLMISLLRSGLGLEEAFRRAGREGLEATHPLAREVALASAELEAGRDPGEAFRALAERTGVRELRAIAAALELSRRLGTSVRATLESQADMLWIRRRELALKRINSGLVKAILPVFLCGIPIFLVLVFFPVMLEFSDMLLELVEFW